MQYSVASTRLEGSYESSKKEWTKVAKEVTPKQSLEGAGVNQGRGSKNILSGVWGCGRGDDAAWCVQANIRIQARSPRANSIHVDEEKKEWLWQSLQWTVMVASMLFLTIDGTKANLVTDVPPPNVASFCGSIKIGEGFLPGFSC